MRAPVRPDRAGLHPGFLVDRDPPRRHQELEGILADRHDARHTRRGAIGAIALLDAIIGDQVLAPGFILRLIFALELGQRLRRRSRRPWREGREPDAAPVGQRVQRGMMPLGERRARACLEARRDFRHRWRTRLRLRCPHSRHQCARRQCRDQRAPARSPPHAHHARHPFSVDPSASTAVMNDPPCLSPRSGWTVIVT